ncbi:MAG: hypothetical protein L0I76_13120 [Pseudonocardia sp.]|nr:hypothetical protein [Pseudonocardia sp.]
MKVRGPLVTLAAVATLALVLLGMNLSRTPAGRPADLAATQAPAGPRAAPATPAHSAPAPPSAPAAPTEAVYAGRSSGDEVTVAIAVRDGAAAGYLCDGTAIEAWLEGTVEGDRVSLSGADGARLSGSIDGDAVFGTVRADAGQSWPFAAEVAPPPAGLYQGEGTVDGTPTRIGWIVLPDGSQVGIATSGGRKNPAPALDPGRGGATVAGAFVPAERIEGGDAAGWPR